jgi:hypothetical protein
MHKAINTIVTRTAQGAAFLTALLCLMAVPSGAFHDSELDPPTKQFLAALIDDLQSKCDDGDARACRLKEQVRTLGNSLARAEQGCATGNRRACQQVAALQEQVESLKETVEYEGSQGDEEPLDRRSRRSRPRPDSPSAQGPSTGRCTAEQERALIKEGFSKDEVRRVCG